MKIFFDTNVWLSGMLGRGLCADLLAAGVEDEAELLLDERVKQEFFRIAETKFQAGEGELALAGEFFAEACVVLPAAEAPIADVPDPDDAWILAAALDAGADWFVTGDKALLDLGQVDDLPIVSPREAYLRLRGLS